MKMNHYRVPTLIMGLAISFNGLANEKLPLDPASPAITVNQQPILRANIDLIVKNKIALGLPATEELRQDVQEELVDQALLAQQSEKKQLDKTTDIQAQLELSRLAILSKAYLDDYFKKNPVTEEDIKKDYEKKRNSRTILEYRISQILVKSKAEANDLITAIRKGADFHKLAQEKSHDPGAHDHGGDVGWLRPDIFIDENFAEAVTKLKKGEITDEPVRTRFGWNIIKLEKNPRPASNVPTYENTNVKLQAVLREKAERKVLDKLIADLKANAQIVAAVSPSTEKNRAQ
jgi:peptidyl-prolyl cis-trans isomerase C